jgi:hypothetical protein
VRSRRGKALLALGVLLADLFARRPPAAKGPRLNYAMVLAMFAVFGLYCGALPFLGFRISTLLYVVASNAMLEPPRTATGYARVALVALITTVVVYYAFERYLSVLLPRGRWTDF